MREKPQDSENFSPSFRFEPRSDMANLTFSTETFLHKPTLTGRIIHNNLNCNFQSAKFFKNLVATRYIRRGKKPYALLEPTELETEENIGKKTLNDTEESKLSQDNEHLPLQVHQNEKVAPAADGISDGESISEEEFDEPDLRKQNRKQVKVADPLDAYDSAKIAAEVQKRRNFAIISHPDAGKTTLVGQDFLSR